jgi:N-acetylmuramic acid 6-phosphate (MurNAc-6-P) etherase
VVQRAASAFNCIKSGRIFWQRQYHHGPSAREFEKRAVSVMAGGDFALIKAVEGFEDFAAFGKNQIADLGLCSKDLIFAITEGARHSFVIGTSMERRGTWGKSIFSFTTIPDEVALQNCRTEP